MWGGEGSFSYGDELKSWRRASKGRALFLRGMENEIYTRWMKRGFDGKFLLEVLAR